MNDQPVPFEASLAQLEECVGALEQGGLTLDEALTRFEDGMRLVTQCSSLLDAAELRITSVLAESDDLAAAEVGDDEEPAF